MTFKQELKKPKYWIHIGIIILVVLGGLKYVFQHDMFTLTWFVKFVVLIAAGDIVAHKILRLD
ncbi:MAG: hypothetical protein DRP42_04935 [Tenericutes bacterium]|nr:MAG: hypothetical protein DRP42_04935 [Mycoplasmatota bacterium]